MAPKDWENETEERKPDPHDSALSVGSRNLDDTAKVRELEDELEDMSEKVASACTLRSCTPSQSIHRILTHPSQHSASPTTKTTSAPSPQNCASQRSATTPSTAPPQPTAQKQPDIHHRQSASRVSAASCTRAKPPPWLPLPLPPHESANSNHSWRNPSPSALLRRTKSTI